MPTAARIIVALAIIGIRIDLYHVEESLYMASFLLEVGFDSMLEFVQILNFNDARYSSSSAASVNRKMDFGNAFPTFQIFFHDFIAYYLFFSFIFVFDYLIVFIYFCQYFIKSIMEYNGYLYFIMLFIFQIKLLYFVRFEVIIGYR